MKTPLTLSYDKNLSHKDVIMASIAAVASNGVKLNSNYFEFGEPETITSQTSPGSVVSMIMKPIFGTGMTGVASVLYRRIPITSFVNQKQGKVFTTMSVTQKDLLRDFNAFFECSLTEDDIYDIVADRFILSESGTLRRFTIICKPSSMLFYGSVSFYMGVPIGLNGLPDTTGTDGWERSLFCFQKFSDDSFNMQRFKLLGLESDTDPHFNPQTSEDGRFNFLGNAIVHSMDIKHVLQRTCSEFVFIGDFSFTWTGHGGSPVEIQTTSFVMDEFGFINNVDTGKFQLEGVNEYVCLPGRDFIYAIQNEQHVVRFNQGGQLDESYRVTVGDGIDGIHVSNLDEVLLVTKPVDGRIKLIKVRYDGEMDSTFNTTVIETSSRTEAVPYVAGIDQSTDGGYCLNVPSRTSQSLSQPSLIVNNERLIDLNYQPQTDEAMHFMVKLDRNGNVDHQFKTVLPGISPNMFWNDPVSAPVKGKTFVDCNIGRFSTLVNCLNPLTGYRHPQWVRFNEDGSLQTPNGGILIDQPKWVTVDSIVAIGYHGMVVTGIHQHKVIDGGYTAPSFGVFVYDLKTLDCKPVARSYSAVETKQPVKTTLFVMEKLND